MDGWSGRSRGIDEFAQRLAPKPELLVKRRRELFAGWTGFALLLTTGFALYLSIRTTYRSLYASDSEYLHPTSWLDTPYSQFAVMGTFALLYLLRLKQAVDEGYPLIPAKAAEDEAVRRRRDAKRFNERLKLIASALNAAGTSALVAGFLVPVLNADDAGGHFSYMGVGMALVCYTCAQIVVGAWKSEE